MYSRLMCSLSIPISIVISVSICICVYLSIDRLTSLPMYSEYVVCYMSDAI